MIIGYLRKLLRHVTYRRERRRRDETAKTELAQRFETALATLPELQRDVYLLHVCDGSSLSDIAVRLDLPSTEIEQYFAAALASLDRQIGTISASDAVARCSPAD